MEKSMDGNKEYRIEYTYKCDRCGKESFSAGYRCSSFCKGRMEVVSERKVEIVEKAEAPKVEQVQEPKEAKNIFDYGKRWQKSGHDRVYLNQEFVDALDLDSGTFGRTDTNPN